MGNCRYYLSLAKSEESILTHKNSIMTTIQHLLDLATQFGGSIVAADTLQPYEHDQAEASGRIATDVNGRKFIWTPDIEDLPENEDEADFFDRWYPLDMEVPEGFFEEIMARINNEKHS